MKRLVFFLGLTTASGTAFLVSCVSDVTMMLPDGAIPDSASMMMDSTSTMDGPPNMDANPMDGGSCMPMAPLSGTVMSTCLLNGSTNTKPLDPGIYKLSTVVAFTSFPGCNSAIAAGGLVVTTNNNNLTIDRLLQTPGPDGGTLTINERWSGTFDAINGKAMLTRDCPPPMVSATWDVAMAPPQLDGGGPTRIKVKDPLFMVRYPASDGGPGVPTLFFLKQ